MGQLSSGSPATRPSGVLTADDARATGRAGDDLRAALRAGELVRVRRGAYVDTGSWAAADEATRYRWVVAAAARRMPGAVFGHDSAAAVWGLSRIGGWPADVHVIVQRDRGRTTPGVHRHRVLVVPETVLVGGIRVPGGARTVVDMARTATFADALAMADHALRAGIATGDGLAQELARADGGRGVRAARRVVAEARAASESVGESLSRARMIELGLPEPSLQHEVRDERGVVARVDFWWAEHGLVGEFDGRVKYRVDGIPDRRRLEDRVWAEKRREDRLRGLGLRVVRWTWADALDPHRLRTVLAGAGLPTP
jgi:hypothetical protein